MNKEIADKWVKELRSGKWTQGYQRLAVKNDLGEMSYCCLGVLCEMAVEAGIVTRKKERVNAPDEAEVYGYSYGGQFSILPDVVQEWAGMRWPAGDVDNQDGSTAFSLASLNDSGKTFEEIADVIEKNVENL